MREGFRECPRFSLVAPVQAGPYFDYSVSRIAKEFRSLLGVLEEFFTRFPVDNRAVIREIFWPAVVVAAVVLENGFGGGVKPVHRMLWNPPFCSAPAHCVVGVDSPAARFSFQPVNNINVRIGEEGLLKRCWRCFDLFVLAYNLSLLSSRRKCAVEDGKLV